MKRRRVLLSLILVLLAGCGGKATLTGKVSYRGKPVTSGSVIVLNADGTARSWVIAPDGTYTVEGVKRGRVKIAVRSPAPARARSILQKEKSKPTGWFPLPAELGDPEKSGLECEVNGSRVEHDLEMK